MGAGTVIGWPRVSGGGREGTDPARGWGLVPALWPRGCAWGGEGRGEDHTQLVTFGSGRGGREGTNSTAAVWGALPTPPPATSSHPGAGQRPPTRGHLRHEPPGRTERTGTRTGDARMGAHWHGGTPTATCATPLSPLGACHPNGATERAGPGDISPRGSRVPEATTATVGAVGDKEHPPAAPAGCQQGAQSGGSARCPLLGAGTLWGSRAGPTAAGRDRGGGCCPQQVPPARGDKGTWRDRPRWGLGMGWHCGDHDGGRTPLGPQRWSHRSRSHPLVPQQCPQGASEAGEGTPCPTPHPGDVPRAGGTAPAPLSPFPPLSAQGASPPGQEPERHRPRPPRPGR